MIDGRKVFEINHYKTTLNKSVEICLLSNIVHANANEEKNKVNQTIPDSKSVAY